MTSRGFKAEGKEMRNKKRLFQEVQAERERLNLLKKRERCSKIRRKNEKGAGSSEREY